MQTKGGNFVKTPQVHLKENVLDLLMQEHDTNITGLVGLTGISQSQLYRITKRKSKVGEDFIARILSVNPSKKFEDYFFVE